MVSHSKSEPSDLYTPIPLLHSHTPGSFSFVAGCVIEPRVPSQGFAKRFSAGLLIQLILNFTSSPLRFLRHPSSFFRSLNKNLFSLGKFFGFYSAIYRVSPVQPFGIFILSVLADQLSPA